MSDVLSIRQPEQVVSLTGDGDGGFLHRGRDARIDSVHAIFAFSVGLHHISERLCSRNVPSAANNFARPPGYQSMYRPSLKCSVAMHVDFGPCGRHSSHDGCGVVVSDAMAIRAVVNSVVMSEMVLMVMCVQYFSAMILLLESVIKTYRSTTVRRLPKLSA